ncbi:acyl-phosphate glycerol 3-phosphate acyltransferase [[Pantoea] beijingensis]|uniref:1-acyl-sn-glycerol-3-phosphate acyltransferase n=1 Tax=[Pantoea] beijingensis TaxID=1324864 RepID=A0A443IB45_9GAMM|nr:MULTISPECIES: 1-acylglycerol-3-phosphate O-acyltransferase [Erwiniaceae]RWR01398.1 acyl-phosphate glycerol 3-phosphate acyltransferase [[Pantoea] beijingensis]
MLLILRVAIVFICSFLLCIFGSIYCLFSPRSPRHASKFAHILGHLPRVLGVKVEPRKPAGAENFGNAIYIANHQSNYDIIIAGSIVQPNTVTVGKTSLLWIPFFGILYWLSGNLLIDRNNRAKAHGTIGDIAAQFKKKKISFWMFPEGTRSLGRGLLPFKTGAFHAAVVAGVPIIPVVVSNTHEKFNFNRLKNGLVIVEMLPPIDVTEYDARSVRKLATYCRELMDAKLKELNAEVAMREANDTV